MIRDVLAIETGDLVFPIIFEVATSREYHAARELYGARFKHISLAISDIDTKFYLISTICRYISIIIRIPETSPHDVNPRHSRFSVLQLKFSKGRQKIWYILVINLQSYFGELWHIIPFYFTFLVRLLVFQHIDFQVEVRVVERQSDVPFVMVYGAGLLVPNLP